MTDEMTPEAARAALHQTSTNSAAVRGRAGWMPLYLGAFGVGFGALALALGLVGGSPVMIGFFAGWGVFCAVMVVWASRRAAHLPGTMARTGRWWGLTAAAYGIALATGIPDQVRNLAFWVPAAVVVAAPMLVGAALEARVAREVPVARP